MEQVGVIQTMQYDVKLKKFKCYAWHIGMAAAIVKTWYPLLSRSTPLCTVIIRAGAHGCYVYQMCHAVVRQI